MSNRYLSEFGCDVVERKVLRNFLRPKFQRDKNGMPVYVTEQSHKAECDIGNIIRKFDKTGLISHVSKVEASYGDMSGMDFKEMNDRIADINSRFSEFPSKIRNRFRNSPEEYLRFMSDSENRNEAIELGLIRGDVAPEVDGLGEHVVDGAVVPSVVPEVPSVEVPSKE